MKKAIKAILENNEARSTAAKAKIKPMKASEKAALDNIGAKIVKTAIEANVTTREVLAAVKGKTPEQIEVVKESVAKHWKEYAESFTARGTHSNKDTVESMKRQSIYNRNSEMQAILSAYQKYASLSKEQRKEFDGKESDCHGYHALVAYARFFNRGKTSTKGGDATPVAVRERKNWLKKKGERITKAKQMIQWAPLDALMVLEEFIEKRIAMLKKAATATAKEGSVTKMRKAA